MKKLLFTTLSIVLLSCSTPEIKEYEPINYGSEEVNCGLITSAGEDQRGDYIEVKMPGYSPAQRDRYEVVDYQEYYLNQKICNFEGLTEQPL